MHEKITLCVTSKPILIPDLFTSFFFLQKCQVLRNILSSNLKWKLLCWWVADFSKNLRFTKAVIFTLYYSLLNSGISGTSAILALYVSVTVNENLICWKNTSFLLSLLCKCVLEYGEISYANKNENYKHFNFFILKSEGWNIWARYFQMKK